jgi:hypothetical protein
MVKYGDVFQQIQERIDSDLDEVVEDEERDRTTSSRYTSSLNDIGHPLVREKSILRTFIGLQELTVAETRCQIIGNVQQLQHLCLDAHEVVVSPHGMLDPLALHQFCKNPGPVITYYSVSLCVPTFLGIQFQCATSRRVIPERQWSPV